MMITDHPDYACLRHDPTQPANDNRAFTPSMRLQGWAYDLVKAAMARINARNNGDV